MITEELQLLIELQKELKAVSEENALMKQKLGIGKFIAPTRPQPNPMDN